jgi:glycosyltransferase involved in cell wall biosynthesis
MTMPTISVVLPTYNGSKYIRSSIESCLNQSFRDFELIIVNDCSTDNTREIIEEYSKLDPRIKIIHNAANKKLPLSLNAGFDVAKGKYHSWTSDDNYYSLDAFEELVRLLEQDPDVGFVYTDYTLIDDSGKITGNRTFGDINKKFTGFQGSSACFLYKEELYKKNNGYNPAAFLSEDYDFFIRSFLLTKTLYVNRYDLYYYREHSASLTGTQKNAVNDIAKLMLERQMNDLSQKLPPDQLALLYRKYAVYHAVQKNNSAGYKTYLGKLWKLSKTESIKTVFYVPFLKAWKAISIGITGLLALLKLVFGGR